MDEEDDFDFDYEDDFEEVWYFAFTIDMFALWQFCDKCYQDSSPPKSAFFFLLTTLFFFFFLDTLMLASLSNVLSRDP